MNQLPQQDETITPQSRSPGFEWVLRIIENRNFADEATQKLHVLSHLTSTLEEIRLRIDRAGEEQRERVEQLRLERAELFQYKILAREFLEVAMELGVTFREKEVVQLAIRLSELHSRARLLISNNAELGNLEEKVELLQDLVNLHPHIMGAHRNQADAIREGLLMRQEFLRIFDTAQEKISRHVVDLILHWKTTMEGCVM